MLKRSLISLFMFSCGGVETVPSLDSGLAPVVRAKSLPCPCAEEGRQIHLLGSNDLVICAPLCSPDGKPFAPNVIPCSEIGLKVDVTDCRLETLEELGLQ